MNIALDAGASTTKDGAKVAESRVRSMKRPEGRNRWKPVLETLRPVELLSEGGVIVGESLACTVDMKRLVKNASRMIRGLYFEVTREALPLDALVGCMPFEQYFKEHQHRPETKVIVDVISTLSGRVIGDGTFEFRYSFDTGQPNCSIWYLEFFRRLAFMGSIRI